MARFVVGWREKIYGWAVVEADSAEEAIAKAKAGDVVEGTQDSEPGKRLTGTYEILDRPSNLDRHNVR